MPCLLVDIDLSGGRIRTKDTAAAEGEKPRDRTGLSDACVVQKTRVHLGSVGVLGSGKGLLDGCNLFRSNAAVAPAAPAGQHHWIEIAAQRVGYHAIGHTVL